jgi:carbonic anhydrase/acetyltransferase-like protein (isoleucine patch superfamily)
MPIIPLPGKDPRIHASAFIAENATIVGDVHIGAQSSVWYGSVIRGDVHCIRIGDRTNIQDLCMVHVTKGTHPCIVENDVTVGHSVTLHGCHIKSRVLVGIGAIVLDGVVVESDSFIAAGALLSPGAKVPSGVLMMGSPAKVKRDLTESEIAAILTSAEHYVQYQEMYR